MLQMVTALGNMDEVDPSRVERLLASKFNGKPWLPRPDHICYEGVLERCALGRMDWIRG